MEGFFMTKRQQFKKFIDEGYTLKYISELMNISRRTTYRWSREYKENTLVREHKLSNKPSNFRSRINRKKILYDYLNLNLELGKDKKFEGYNFSYYYDKKFDKTLCSYGTFKGIMKENLVASPQAHRKTKKLYNKLLKEKLKKKNRLSNKETKLIKDTIDLNEKQYFRRARPDHAGEIVEVDACQDYWLGVYQSHLHAAYDPATRTILALHLEKEETTHGYYKILHQLISNKTIPIMFKGDCRSSFVINKKNAGALAHKDVNTQFGFTLEQIGVRMENSSEPTFKGAVERFFRTAQNHLKGEFREREITTFKEANEYLCEYMKWFNNKYSIKAKKKETKYKSLNLTEEQIDDLLSIRAFRKTDKANAISFKNTMYSLYSEGERVIFKEKSPILIYKTLSGKLKAEYKGLELELKKTTYTQLTKSQQEQYDNARRITPHFSAPDYHPWGYKVFTMYLHRTNQLSRYSTK